MHHLLLQCVCSSGGGGGEGAQQLLMSPTVCTAVKETFLRVFFFPFSFDASLPTEKKKMRRRRRSVLTCLQSWHWNVIRDNKVNLLLISLGVEHLQINCVFRLMGLHLLMKVQIHSLILPSITFYVHSFAYTYSPLKRIREISIWTTVSCKNPIRGTEILLKLKLMEVSAKTELPTQPKHVPQDISL